MNERLYGTLVNVRYHSFLLGSNKKRHKYFLTKRLLLNIVAINFGSINRGSVVRVRVHDKIKRTRTWAATGPFVCLTLVSSEL